MIVTALKYVSRRWRGLSSEADRVQDLVEGVKVGNFASCREAAQVLALRLGAFEGIVVGAPRSSRCRPSLDAFAQELAIRIGGRALPGALARVEAVASSRDLRRRGLEGVGEGRHAASIRADIAGARHVPILVVDEVVTTGATLRGCGAALRRAGHLGPVQFAALARAQKGVSSERDGAFLLSRV